jgi:hypothetical protein
MNPVRALQFYFLKMDFNIILQCGLRSSKSFYFRLLHSPSMHSFSPPYVPQVPFSRSHQKYLLKTTKYEPFITLIFQSPSASNSQTLTFALCDRLSFTTIHSKRKNDISVSKSILNHSSVCFNNFVFGRRQQYVFLDCMIASICWI